MLFDGEWPFGGSSYLAVDNLTVLLGANGAGKTTTLRILQAHLPATSAPAPSPDDDLSEVSCTFFVEVSQEQLDVLLADQLAAQDSDDAPPVPWRWEDPAWPSSEHYPSALKEGSPSERWLASLLGHVPQGLDAQALETMAGSRLIAVNRSAGQLRFDLAWCLPTERLPSQAHGSADGASDSRLVEEWGRPPKPLVPLGSTNRTMLPATISVPTALGEIQTQLREAFVDILVHLRWGERDRWAREHRLPLSEQASRRGTRAWLANPDADVATIEPAAKALCRLSSSLATALAPAFVTEAHEVEISVEPIYEWERGGPRLRLALKRPPGIVFPVDRAADGHKVWLQLALLETIAILRRYLDVLDALLDRAVSSTDPPGKQRASLEWEQYLAAVDLLQRFGRLGQGDAPPPLDQFTALRNVGHRLYLIDEPEQHLHPRLQRSATRWLAEAGTAGASQCVVVTHSPHYLRIPGRVAFGYLQAESRTGRSPRSVIRVLTPEFMAATDAVAAEMGFDRGELLGGVDLVVFVEGQADKLFLEALYGHLLHHSGIALIPIHGAVGAQKKGVVDSEMVLVWTAARLAILLDNLVETEWRELQADAEYCREQSRKAGKTELQAMAAVLTRANEIGRHIEPVGIPVPDIFDLLDEAELRARFPRFPGHEVARRKWQEAVSKQKINWKAFYREQYGIEIEPALFGEVATAMAETGHRPLAADALVDALQQLSTTAAKPNDPASQAATDDRSPSERSSLKTGTRISTNS